MRSVTCLGDELGAGHVKAEGFRLVPERVRPLVHALLDVVRDGSDWRIEFEVDVRARHGFLRRQSAASEIVRNSGSASRNDG
jgi:hypothetical protein